MSNQRITDNLDSMLSVLPPEISQALTAQDKNADLIEIILDLGPGYRSSDIRLFFKALHYKSLLGIIVDSQPFHHDSLKISWQGA